ncbi:MAG: transketolase [Treponema sp.]|jgi:transketolase|nr:transketolase [Treponema sp.]
MNTIALKDIALSIRGLSMDAIQKAKSGHPGLPLGAAELGAILYGEILRHDPADPAWPDRDRFILSAGHGSMLLYSLLYLSGYEDISLDDIKTFRQIGSHAAGHPEYGLVRGIEATSGPLGQGLSMAVGCAIAETMLAARFNTARRRIVDHYTYTLAGDGCLMEGVSSEAGSLAGRLELGKLIVFYDSNHITIDGSTSLAFTEDVAARYKAYGWQVLQGSMYNFEEIAQLVSQAQRETAKPSLIILESTIGKGAPTKQNTADVHGAPLGAEEIAAARAALGIPAGAEGDFYTGAETLKFFKAKQEEWKKARQAWQTEFDAWSREEPELRKQWDDFYSGDPAPSTGGGSRKPAISLPVFNGGDKVATRSAGNKALEAISAACPNLVGGSADLKSPNAVGFSTTAYSPANREGRYIHFGIREFAMAAIANGIQLHGGLRAFCATFMVFSDYLRPALRLSALMDQPVIYVLTHDSIFVGEDGPTHQPVEHLASLRAIPNVRLLRPADAEETAEAWAMAMERHNGPTILALSRQNLTVFPKDDPDWRNTVRTGAYIVKKAGEKPDAVIIATGSEVGLALEAARLAEQGGKKVRVVSMISRELFESQPEAIHQSIIPPGTRVICCEAGIKSGWERWAKPEDILSVDRFGISGPADKVAEALGFTAGALAAIINR